MQKTMLNNAHNAASIEICMAVIMLNFGISSIRKNSFLTSNFDATPFATRELITHGTNAE